MANQETMAGVLEGLCNYAEGLVGQKPDDVCFKEMQDLLMDVKVDRVMAAMSQIDGDPDDNTRWFAADMVSSFVESCLERQRTFAAFAAALLHLWAAFEIVEYGEPKSKERT